MTDFEYQSYDISTLKVRFQNLRKAEEQGFWLGAVFGMPFGVWLVNNKFIQHKFKAGLLMNSISALACGSLVYGAYIFGARASYNDVAAKVNRKYSLLLNKAMTYN